jgi:hypothetical protein
VSLLLVVTVVRVPVVIMVIMVSVGRGVLCVRVGEREEMEGRHLSAISE